MVMLMGMKLNMALYKENFIDNSQNDSYRNIPVYRNMR